MSFTDFLAAQLRAAGVPALPAPNLTWFDANTEKFALPSHYAVLISGSSPNAPHKRWPPQKFAALAKRLRDKGLACVAVGTGLDAEAIAVIKAFVPETVDLCGKTNLFELAGILRRAAIVIGNDTGPLHMAAALQTPTVALFSEQSNPVWSKPPGPKVAWRQSQNLEDLSVAEVFSVIDSIYDFVG
jgi:ADP-heptose:LPS heptosyltransferase